MNGIYQNYQIDLSGNNNFVQYNTVQGDGNGVRGFEIELTEKNKPYVPGNDVEVFIAGTKPDTKQIFNSCEVTEQGTILVDVTTQMSAVAGRGYYQIVLISKTTNKQLKSFPFIIYVKESAFHAETITSSNEFHALNGMVNKIESTLNKTDLVDNMLESSSQILADTTTAYNNAVQSLEKAQDAIDTAESINSTAEESANNAKQSEENSLLYSNLSKSYAVGTNDEIRENDSTDNAKYYKEQSALNSASALQSANLAGQKSDAACLSESNAQQYALSAAGSEANAKISEDNAKNSEENALKSSSNAMQSAVNSENSAKSALESATNAGLSELAAKDYSEKAAKSAEKAENIVGITIATQERAGIVKPDGTTITIDEDGTLHGANTLNVDGQSIVKTDDNVLKVSDTVLNKLDSLSNADDELSEYINNRFDTIEDNFGTVDNELDKLKYNTDTTFDEETERVNIVSGEKLSSVLGKIRKWFFDLKAVAFSGSYSDLTNTPDIPTVGNGTITITQNGENKGSFSMNQNGNTSIALSWRGIQDNLSSTSTTDSLSANQGRLLANGDARDSTKMPSDYFHWLGQSGQPSWLWGGNNENDYYVYNPANFNVNSAVNDSDGRKIVETYATKSEISNSNIKQDLVHIHTGSEGSWSADVNYGSMGYTQIPVAMFLTNRSDNVYNVSYENRDKTLHIVVNRSSGHGNDNDTFWIVMIGK